MHDVSIPLARADGRAGPGSGLFRALALAVALLLATALAQFTASAAHAATAQCPPNPNSVVKSAGPVQPALALSTVAPACGGGGGGGGGGGTPFPTVYSGGFQIYSNPVQNVMIISSSSALCLQDDFTLQQCDGADHQWWHILPTGGIFSITDPGSCLADLGSGLQFAVCGPGGLGSERRWIDSNTIGQGVNTILWNQGTQVCLHADNPGAAGSTVRVNGNGCDNGNDELWTFLSVPQNTAISLKYMVLGVDYAPPGSSSSVDYGTTTASGTKVSASTSFTHSFSTSSDTRQKDANGIPVAGGTGDKTTKTFTQTAAGSASLTLEKSTSDDTIIPGPANSADGISHDQDVILLWLNPQMLMTRPVPNLVLWNGFAVDSRDAPSYTNSMDVVSVTVGQLRNRSFDPGTASRLQRSWSGTGALAPADYDQILTHDPFASGSQTIDLNRFELLQNMNYTPAAVGGQPITQKFSVATKNTHTEAASVTLTDSVSREVQGLDPTGVNAGGLDNTSTFTVTDSAAIERTDISGQSMALSITGPKSDYQGPTGVQIYQDDLYGTLMFAYAQVPTYRISSNGSAQTVNQGDTAKYPIDTTSDFGYSGNIVVSASNLPSGLNAPSVTVAAGSPTTLSISVPANFAPGTYNFSIDATDGSSTPIVRHIPATLKVNPLGYTLSVTPANGSVNPGGTASFTVTVTAAPGFPRTVKLLSPSNLPPQSSAAYDKTSINGSGSATLFITTSANTPPATFPFTVTADDGVLPQQTASATLTVTATPPPDFTFSQSPNAVSVGQGGSATTTVSAAAVNGFSGNVSLTASGLPTGATASFSPASVSGSGSSTLTIAAGPSTTPGTYPVTVTAASGALTHSQTLSLTVTAAPPPPAADFGISASPSAASAAQGASSTATVTIAPSNGFTAPVALSASGLPSGVTAAFAPATVTGGSGSSTLTLAAGASAAPGTYTVMVTATSGPLSHVATVALTVMASEPSGGGQAFSGVAGPSCPTDGNHWTHTNSSRTDMGFTQANPVTSSGALAGTGCTDGFLVSSLTQDASISPTGDNYFWWEFGLPVGTEQCSVSAFIPDTPLATGTFTYYVSDNKDTYHDIGHFPVNQAANRNRWVPLGTVTTATGQLMVEIMNSTADGGTPGSVSNLIAGTLKADCNTIADFTMLAQNAPGITAGGTGQITVSTTDLGGFTGDITLSASGLPAGATASVTANPVNPSTGAGTSTVNIATTSATPAGSYPITLTATSGGITHSQTVNLTVS